MANRNIAIALFDPEEQVESCWPRFTGWKIMGSPHIESGLFGLVDKSTRMHRFFKNTDIKTVLTQQLRFKQRGIDVSVRCADVDFTSERGGNVKMPPGRTPDTSIKWLVPYTYIQEDGTEWDVYVVITGRDLLVMGDFQLSFKVDGYWDMGIWKPSEEELKSDIFRIEQATINHVNRLGHYAWYPEFYIDDNNVSKYKYLRKEVVRELPDWGNVDIPEVLTQNN